MLGLKRLLSERAPCTHCTPSLWETEMAMLWFSVNGKMRDEETHNPNLLFPISFGNSPSLQLVYHMYVHLLLRKHVLRTTYQKLFLPLLCKSSPSFVSPQHFTACSEWTEYMSYAQGAPAFGAMPPTGSSFHLLRSHPSILSCSL